MKNSASEAPIIPLHPQNHQEREEISNTIKTQILSELEKAHATKERVELFGKVMDDYGVDFLISLVPEWGDISSSLLSTCYLLYEGKKIWLSTKATLKILGYQVADVAVGAIPILGDIADYFFKANKRSAQVFQDHFEKLQQKAIANGISKGDIQTLQQNNAKFVQVMNKIYDKKLKKAA